MLVLPLYHHGPEVSVLYHLQRGPASCRPLPVQEQVSWARGHPRVLPSAPPAMGSCVSAEGLHRALHSARHSHPFMVSTLPGTWQALPESLSTQTTEVFPLDCRVFQALLQILLDRPAPSLSSSTGTRLPTWVSQPGACPLRGSDTHTFDGCTRSPPVRPAFRVLFHLVATGKCSTTG